MSSPTVRTTRSLSISCRLRPSSSAGERYRSPRSIRGYLPLARPRKLVFSAYRTTPDRPPCWGSPRPWRISVGGSPSATCLIAAYRCRRISYRRRHLTSCRNCSGEGRLAADDLTGLGECTRGSKDLVAQCPLLTRSETLLAYRHSFHPALSANPA